MVPYPALRKDRHMSICSVQEKNVKSSVRHTLTGTRHSKRAKHLFFQWATEEKTTKEEGENEREMAMSCESYPCSEDEHDRVDHFGSNGVEHAEGLHLDASR